MHIQYLQYTYRRLSPNSLSGSHQQHYNWVHHVPRFINLSPCLNELSKPWHMYLQDNHLIEICIEGQFFIKVNVIRWHLVVMNNIVYLNGALPSDVHICNLHKYLILKLWILNPCWKGTPYDVVSWRPSSFHRRIQYTAVLCFHRKLEGQMEMNIRSYMNAYKH